MDIEERKTEINKDQEINIQEFVSIIFPIKNVDTVIIWDCRILRTVSLQYDYSMIKVSLQYFHIRYTFGNLHTVLYILLYIMSRTV